MRTTISTTILALLSCHGVRLRRLCDGTFAALRNYLCVIRPEISSKRTMPFLVPEVPGGCPNGTGRKVDKVRVSGIDCGVNRSCSCLCQTTRFAFRTMGLSRSRDKHRVECVDGRSQ